MLKKIKKLLRGGVKFLKGAMIFGTVAVTFLATLQSNGPRAVKQARRWRSRQPDCWQLQLLEKGLEKIVAPEEGDEARR